MNKHKNSVSLVCRACGKKAKDGEHLRSVTVPNYKTAKLLSLLNQDENKPDHEKVCRGCLRKMQSFGSKSRSEDHTLSDHCLHCIAPIRDPLLLKSEYT